MLHIAQHPDTPSSIRKVSRSNPKRYGVKGCLVADRTESRCPFMNASSPSGWGNGVLLQIARNPDTPLREPLARVTSGSDFVAYRTNPDTSSIRIPLRRAVGVIYARSPKNISEKKRSYMEIYRDEEGVSFAARRSPGSFLTRSLSAFWPFCYLDRYIWPRSHGP